MIFKSACAAVFLYRGGDAFEPFDEVVLNEVLSRPSGALTPRMRFLSAHLVSKDLHLEPGGLFHGHGHRELNRPLQALSF